MAEAQRRPLSAVHFERSLEPCGHGRMMCEWLQMLPGAPQLPGPPRGHGGLTSHSVGPGARPSAGPPDCCHPQLPEYLAWVPALNLLQARHKNSIRMTHTYKHTRTVMSPVGGKKQGDIISNLLCKQPKQLCGNILLIKRINSFQIRKKYLKNIFKLLYQCWYLLSEMGMPNEDLQADWNAVSFSSDVLGRCTAVLELHLLGRNTGNDDLIYAQHRNQRCAEGILN